MKQQLQILMDFQIIWKAMCRYCQSYHHGLTYTTSLVIPQEPILMKTWELEAFSFFVCNHVRDVFGHSISKKSKFCCVKTKEKHTYVWFEKNLQMSSIFS